MTLLVQPLKDCFQKVVARLYGEGFSSEVVPAKGETFGDYQFNSAMKIAKSLRQSPQKIAEEILHNLSETEWDRFVAKAEVASPGFINIWLRNDFLEKLLHEQLASPTFGYIWPGPKERVIVEFSSPNTAKELHIGHLRSTIIGEALARMFSFAGHDVLRLNHVGDWGTAFGMLIVYLEEREGERLQKGLRCTLQELVQDYKAAKLRFDEDSTFREKARLRVVDLQSGEPKALFLWQQICQISRDSYEEIYRLLDVSIQERGESFYNPMLATIVQELQDKGLITISDGAKCIYQSGFTNREGGPLPLMVQKSDGGYNYDTTDMAAMAHRIREEKADRIVIITDSGQATHFAMIFQAAKAAQYDPNDRVKMVHVPFGMVLGLDGKKFRTRSGETISLREVIDQAIVKAKETLTLRGSFEGDELDEASCKLGIAALKWADLSTHRISGYTFSYEKMLRFEGNTAPYILYSYVRALSILRKVKSSSHEKVGFTLLHPSERALALHIARFPAAFAEAIDELLPNRLTDYLYLLAERFNGFFRDCRVEGDEREGERVALCLIVKKLLEKGLTLLAIPLMEKM